MAKVAKSATKAGTKTAKKTTKAAAKPAARTTAKPARKSPPKLPKTTPVMRNLPSEITRNWSWLLGLGVLFIILGLLGLSSIVGVTLISIVFIGFLFVIAGLAQFVDVFKSKKWKVATWHGLIALFYLLGGCFIVWDPLLASTLITALIGWTLVIIGIVRMIMAISLHGTPGWGFTLIASLAAILLGGIILMQWPMSSLWVIGLFISIELLMNGLNYLIMSIAIRKKLKI